MWRLGIAVSMGALLFCNEAAGGKRIPSDMALVPAGWFIMGSDAGQKNNKPQRRVYLNAFLIDKYEVTNAQYKEYLDRKRKETGILANVPTCEVSASDTVPNYRKIWDKTKRTFPPEFANYPVTCVSWFIANDYCLLAGKALPTEAQWEKAARGPKGFIYPWGNDWNPANLNHGLGKESWEDPSDGYARAAPVGSFPKDVSPYGVYDIGGNVWEWTRDMYSKDYYTWGPRKNPPGPTLQTIPPNQVPFSSKYKMVRRGGSWTADAEMAKNFIRVDRPNSYRDDAGGFRCARQLK